MFLNTLNSRLLTVFLLFNFLLTSSGIALAQEGATSTPSLDTPPPSTESPTTSPVPSLPQDDVQPAPSEPTLTPPESPTEEPIGIEPLPEPESASAVSAGGAPPQVGKQISPLSNGWASSKESVEVEASSGAATYFYPLQIPPGRNGVEPKLGIFYNHHSGNDNSIYGYGWDLPMGYVSRSTLRGTQRMYEQKEFVVDIFGAGGDIAQKTLTDGLYGEYQARIDNGAFLKYTFNSDDSWTITDKLGVTYTFGTTSAARQDDPDDSSLIFKWFLEEIRDLNDNFIEFEYFKDSGEIYPKSIIYTGNSTTSGDITVNFEPFASGTSSVAVRDDVTISYLPSFKVTTNYLIDVIEITVTDQNGGNPVWEYDLDYESGDNTKRSMLTSILKTGRDSNNLTASATTSFAYTDKPAGWDASASSTWASILPFTNASTSGVDLGVRLIDVNGDALFDLVKSYLSSTNYLTKLVHINTGSGWDSNSSSTWANALPDREFASATGTDTAVRFSDVDGDGLVDILYSPYPYFASTSEVYINNGLGWTKDTKWVLPQPFLENSTDSGVRIVDVNADGLPDIIRFYETTSALPFSDDFNRTDSNTVGNGWSEDEVNGTSFEIASNQLNMINTSGAGGGRSIYRVGSEQNNIKLSGTFKIDSWTDGSGDSWGGIIGVHGPSSDPAQFFASSFGLHFNIENNAVELVDNGWEAVDASTSWTYTVGTTYDWEFIINQDYSVEIRLWGSTSSRPSTPTLSASAQTPSANGVGWGIGYDKASNDSLVIIFDDFSVEDLEGEENLITKRVYINNGGSWLPNDSTWASNLSDRAISSTASSTIWATQLADVNSDGLVDIIYAPYGTTSEVYLGTGTSTGWTLDAGWSVPISFESASSTDNGARFIDANGDGLIDIVQSYKSGGTHTKKVFLNNGNGWNADDANWSSNLPSHAFADASTSNETVFEVQVADVNGDVLPDIVYAPGEGVSAATYLDKTGWPDFASQVALNSGGYNQFAYTSSAYYRDSSSQSLNPQLPFIVPVVQQFGQDDGLGTTASTSYIYRGGNYNTDDIFDRQFTGFYLTERTDPLGNLVKSYFHQGGNTDGSSIGEYSDHISKKGRLFRVEMYSGTTSKISQLVNKWDKLEYEDGVEFGVASTSIALWHFDGNASDSSGNLRDLTENGGVQNVSGGVSNNAYDFPNDTSKYLSLSNDDAFNFGTDDFTIHAWIKPDALTDKGIIGKKDSASASDSGWALYLDSSGKPAILMSGNSTDESSIASSSPATGEWNLVTFVRMDGEHYWYLNGSFDVVSKETPQDIGTSSTLTIGKLTYGSAFDGLIDEVLVENKGWNGADVNEYYSQRIRYFLNLTQIIDFTFDGESTSKDRALIYNYATTTGNIISELNYGEVTGSSSGTFVDIGNDKLTTNIEYASNSTSSIFGFTSSITKLDQSDTQLSQQRFYYDDLAIQEVDTGNQTKGERWLNGTSSSYINMQRAHDSFGNVTSIINELGATTSITYDSYNLYPATTTNALLQTTFTSYHMATGQVATSTDANGFITEKIYDPLGRVKQIKVPDITTPSIRQIQQEFVYTDTGMPRKIEHKRYGSAGGSAISTFTYLDGFRRKVQERAEAETASQYMAKDFIYNERGELTRESLPYFDSGSAYVAASSTRLSYNNTYDAIGRLMQVVNPVATTTYAYVRWGTTITDGNENQKILTRDAYNRLISVEDPGDSGSGALFSDDFDRSDDSDPGNSWTEVELNNKSHIVISSNELKFYTDGGAGGGRGVHRDPVDSKHSDIIITGKFKSNSTCGGAGGVVVGVLGPSSNVNFVNTGFNAVFEVSNDTVKLLDDGSTDGSTSFSFNTSNYYQFEYRIDSDWSIDIKVWEDGTEKPGTPTLSVNSQTPDASGNKWTIGWDSCSSETTDIRIDDYSVADISASGGVNTTTYEYDLLSNLTKITDAYGNIRNFAYDTLSRLSSAEDLHATSDATYGTWSYQYDDASNLTQRTDAKSQVVNYTYDDINRLLTEDYTGESGTEVTYTYDISSTTVGYLGTVFASSSNATTSYSYDSHGNITNETLSVSTTTSYFTTKIYDLLGRVTNISYPDGADIKYTYNDAGFLETVEKKESGEGSFTDVITNFTYGASGLPTTINYQNGVTTTNTYDIDQLYRLTNKLTSISGNNLQNIAYTYDAVGNITQLTDTSNTSTSKTLILAYDNLYRLTSASTTTVATNTSGYVQTYTYNLIGNITNKSDVGDYSYDGTDKANPHAATDINGTTYAYDDNGNLTSDGTRTITWNYNNWPTDVVISGATTSFTYDYQGNRIKKSTSTSSVTYINQFYELEGNKKRKYLYGDTDVYAIVEQDGTSSPVVVNIHPDHLSGMSILTDASGSQVELIDYYPFGESRLDETDPSASSSPRKYTGQELDEETALYYYGARYYNPKIGRFVSVDPAFLLIGMQGFEANYGKSLEKLLSNPQEFNSYSYVRNNPYRYIDPNGEIVILAPILAGAGVGFIVGSFQARNAIADMIVSSYHGDHQRAIAARNQAINTIGSNVVGFAIGGLAGAGAGFVAARSVGQIAGSAVGGFVGGGTNYTVRTGSGMLIENAGVGEASSQGFSLTEGLTESVFSAVASPLLVKAGGVNLRLQSRSRGSSYFISSVSQTTRLLLPAPNQTKLLSSPSRGSSFSQSFVSQGGEATISSILSALSRALSQLSSILRSFRR